MEDVEETVSEPHKLQSKSRLCWLVATVLHVSTKSKHVVTPEGLADAAFWSKAVLLRGSD